MTEYNGNDDQNNNPQGNTIEGEFQLVPSTQNNNAEPQAIKFPRDESGAPSKDAVELAKTLSGINMPGQTGRLKIGPMSTSAFDFRLSKVLTWGSMGFRPTSNIRAQSLDVVRPVLKNLYDKMENIGLSSSIRTLNQDVLDAALEGKDYKAILDKFANENKDSLVRFEAEAVALREHVQNTFVTNKIRVGTKSKVGLGHDLTVGQKRNLLIFLDKSIDMVHDLAKGSEGNNAREIETTLQKVASGVIEASEVSSKKSLTGLFSAYEYATNAAVTSNKNNFFPGTKQIVPGEWEDRAARIIDSESYTDYKGNKLTLWKRDKENEEDEFYNGERDYAAVCYDNIPGNLEAKWQNDILHRAERNENGKINVDFKKEVEAKFAFLEDMGVFFDDGFAHENVFSMITMMRVTGDENSATLPSPNAFDVAARRFFENAPYTPYNRHFISKMRDVCVQFKNIEGAEDTSRNILPNTMARFFDVNRKNMHHAESSTYFWDYLTRYPGTGSFALPGRIVAKPAIFHWMVKKPLAHITGAFSSDPGERKSFGITKASYTNKKSDKKSGGALEDGPSSQRPSYVYMAKDKEGNKIESFAAPIRRMAVRLGPIAAAALIPAVPAALALAPLFISDIGGKKGTGGIGVPFDIPLGKMGSIPLSRIRVKFTKPTAALGIIAAPIGALALAASLAFNGLPDVNYGDIFKADQNQVPHTQQIEQKNTSGAFNDKVLQQHDMDNINANPEIQELLKEKNETLQNHDMNQILNNPEIKDDVEESKAARKLRPIESASISVPHTLQNGDYSDKVLHDFEHASYAVTSEKITYDKSFDDYDVSVEHDIA